MAKRDEVYLPTSEEIVQPKEDAELDAIVRAARIRMERGAERVTVPIVEVRRLQAEGWVICGNQG